MSECEAFIKDYEYSKIAAPSAPIFKLEIIPCDYNRGWTWYLQIGRRTFAGWEPVPMAKPRSSPEEAYAHFMKWANRVGIEKISEAIASEQKALKA